MDALRSRTVLVTGGTSGIGFHTAEGLARMGATVFITGRDQNRGLATESLIRRHAGHDRVRFIEADCSTVRGNEDLAHQLMAQTDRLHILVNNVGGQFNDRTETGDGYEATLAMNAIGPFALTQCLLPLLRSSQPARIVNLASAAHGMWKGDPFADLQGRQRYLSSEAYARAKLLNILWTFALARRLEGSGIVANATHPGLAWTSMTRSMAPRSMPGWVRPLWPVLRFMQRCAPASRSARSSIFLAGAPAAARFNGKYFASNGRQAVPSVAALDPITQEAAWETLSGLVAQARARSAVRLARAEVTGREELARDRDLAAQNARSSIRSDESSPSELPGKAALERRPRARAEKFPTPDASARMLPKP